MDKTIKSNWSEMKDAHSSKREAQKNLRFQRSYSQDLLTTCNEQEQELKEIKKNGTGYVKRSELAIAIKE
jgi:hypothetical protein